MKEKLVELIKYSDDRIQICHWDSYCGNDLIFEIDGDKIYLNEYYGEELDSRLKEVTLIEMLNLILDNNG